MRTQIKILIIFTFLAFSCQEKRNAESKNQFMNSDEFHISKTTMDQKIYDCYSILVKLNTKDSVFIDTTINLRNYQINDSNKCIICNHEFIDSETEKLIWECKYIETYLYWVERLDTNRFAILDYKKNIDSSIIARFYISDKRDLKTIQMTSFLVTNGEIVGINICPLFKEQFTPIEAFDNTEPVEM